MSVVQDPTQGTLQAPDITVPVAGDGVALPEGFALADAAYTRSGPDLVLIPAGRISDFPVTLCLGFP